MSCNQRSTVYMFHLAWLCSKTSKKNIFWIRCDQNLFCANSQANSDGMSFYWNTQIYGHHCRRNNLYIFEFDFCVSAGPWRPDDMSGCRKYRMSWIMPCLESAYKKCSIFSRLLQSKITHTELILNYSQHDHCISQHSLSPFVFCNADSLPRCYTSCCPVVHFVHNVVRRDCVQFEHNLHPAFIVWLLQCLGCRSISLHFMYCIDVHIQLHHSNTWWYIQ